MTTDFFDRQDHARRLTVRFLVMFALSVVVIILTIYLLLAVGTRGYQPLDTARDFAAGRATESPSLWNPALFAGVTFGTILVISLGSLYKISELSGGGQTVALLVGGRPINPQTHDLAERRLLNIVEEIALASGIPVPPVFVLDNEPGINAFAAGYHPGDAVLTVSAGCLRYLTREELQGVIGHEMSHVVNGDMRLNLRLVGIVFGILVLAIIGYYILRSAGSVSSSRDSKGGAAAVMLFGLILLVLGYLGVFLGDLIKSAISRQRELLADASAVQFTRDTAGLAGALKKIGGLEEGSRIGDAHAAEFSHMFFADAFAGGFFNLFATHPPLVDRIRALEPDFDGRYPNVQPVVVDAADVAAPARGAKFGPLGPLAGAAGIAAAAGTVDAAAMLQRVGSPQLEHLSHAAATIDAMPEELLDSAREPSGAQAVIYALLLSRTDEATRTAQLQLLEKQLEPPTYQETQQLADAARTLPAASELPLVNLSVPALKKSSPQQYARFRQAVDSLVKADGKLDLFEYCLRMVLFSYLDVHFGLKKPPAIRYRTAAAVAQPATVVLSMLAYADEPLPDIAAADFQAGAQGLLGQVAILPQEQCTLRAFDAALAELAQCSPDVKRAIMTAITACIAAAGKITLEESELLRAVAAVLACPMPPIAATVTGV